MIGFFSLIKYKIKMLSSQTLGKLCQDKTIKENDFFGMVMCHTNYTCGIDMFFRPDGEIKGRSRMCADVAETIQSAKRAKRSKSTGGEHKKKYGVFTQLYRYLAPTELDKHIKEVNDIAKKAYDERDSHFEMEKNVKQFENIEKELAKELTILEEKTKTITARLTVLTTENTITQKTIDSLNLQLKEEDKETADLDAKKKEQEGLEADIASRNQQIGSLRATIELMKKTNQSTKTQNLLDEQSLLQQQKDLEVEKDTLAKEREKTTITLARVMEQKESIAERIFNNLATRAAGEAELREKEKQLKDAEEKLSNLNGRIANVTGKLDQLQGSTKMYFASALNTIENNQGSFILGGLASMSLFILYYGMKVFREYTKTKIQKKQEEENALFKEPGLPPSYLFALLEMPIEARKIVLLTEYDFANCLLLMKPDGTPRTTQEDCDLALSKYGAMKGYLVKRKRQSSSSSRKKSRQSRSRRHLSMKAA
jgi:hypothetical protein